MKPPWSCRCGATVKRVQKKACKCNNKGTDKSHGSDGRTGGEDRRLVFTCAIWKQGLAFSLPPPIIFSLSYPQTHTIAATRASQLLLCVRSCEKNGEPRISLALVRQAAGSSEWRTDGFCRHSNIPRGIHFSPSQLHVELPNVDARQTKISQSPDA